MSMGFSRQEYWSGVPLPSPNLCLPRGKTTCYPKEQGRLLDSISSLPIPLTILQPRNWDHFHDWWRLLTGHKGQLCSSLSILWHWFSLGLEWKLTYYLQFCFLIFIMECYSKDGLSYSEVTRSLINSKCSTTKLPISLFCLSQVGEQTGLLHSHSGAKR